MTFDFCPSEGTSTSGMTRRRALALAGASLVALAGGRRAMAEEDEQIVVCKATLDMDQPYEKQTISSWELETYDVYPVPAEGCRGACEQEIEELCAGRCGTARVTCGRFTSEVECPPCATDAKTASGRDASGRKASRKRKKRTAND